MHKSPNWFISLVIRLRQSDSNMILATMYLLLLQVTQPSPIIRLVKMKPAPPEEPPSTSVCDLPKRLGGSGTKTFLEDCHPKEALG